MSTVQSQELVIIDIWTVAPRRQQEMTRALRAALEKLRRIDGFIEGDVLANWDETRVASFVRFR